MSAGNRAWLTTVECIMNVRNRRIGWLAAACAAAAVTAVTMIVIPGPQGNVVSLRAASSARESVSVVASPLTAAGPLLNFTWGSGWITAQAPDDVTQHDLREVFWYSDATPALNSESCATWTAADGAIVQQGAALRIAERGGVQQAITVTRNIYGKATWVFNVHLWVGSQFTLIGQFNLAPAFRLTSTEARPLPWRLCARAIGSMVEFKVWLLGHPEPQWGDTTHGGAVILPAGWEYAGVSGWYAGHLYTDDLASFRDLDVTTLPQVQRYD